MEYYSAIKSKTLVFAATQMEQENIMLSEINQRQIYDITYMWNLQNYTSEAIHQTEIE